MHFPREAFDTCFVIPFKVFSWHNSYAHFIYQHRKFLILDIISYIPIQTPLKFVSDTKRVIMVNIFLDSGPTSRLLVNILFLSGQWNHRIFYFFIFFYLEIIWETHKVITFTFDIKQLLAMYWKAHCCNIVDLYKRKMKLWLSWKMTIIWITRSLRKPSLRFAYSHPLPSTGW